MDLIWKVGARAKEILVLKENQKTQDEVKSDTKPAEESETETKTECRIEKTVTEAEGEVAVDNTDVVSDKSSTPEYDDNENMTPGTKESETEQAKAKISSGDIKDVSLKAVASAKTFGSYLYGVANRTSKSLTETAKHLKHTVEQNSILGDFNKEQEAFMNNKAKTSDAGLPPWAGCENEENVKQEILSLSADKRNFLRSPPSGVLFDFNFDAMYPVATVMLKEDPALEKMRFELVPKLVSEENFWRNYFYRVSLLKQSTRLSSMSQQKNDEWEKELQQELQEYEVVAGDNADDDPAWENEIDKMIGEEKVKDIV